MKPVFKKVATVPSPDIIVPVWAGSHTYKLASIEASRIEFISGARDEKDAYCDVTLYSGKEFSVYLSLASVRKLKELAISTGKTVAFDEVKDIEIHEATAIFFKEKAEEKAREEAKKWEKVAPRETSENTATKGNTSPKAFY